jgi:hypothetical protein
MLLLLHNTGLPILQLLQVGRCTCKLYKPESTRQTVKDLSFECFERGTIQGCSRSSDSEASIHVQVIKPPAGDKGLLELPATFPTNSAGS